MPSTVLPIVALISIRAWRGVFEAAYGVTQDLVYLNALLKCVDTLCSVQDLLGEDGRARLAWLIGREGAHIEALTEKVARR